MLNLTDDQLEIRALRATEYELRDQVALLQKKLFKAEIRDQVALLQKELFKAQIEIQTVANQIYSRIDEQVLSNERFASTN